MRWSSARGRRCNRRVETCLTLFTSLTPTRRATQVSPLHQREKFAHVLSHPIVAAAQRGGVAVAGEEVDGLRRVEVVLRAGAFAVFDLGRRTAQLFRDLGNLLQIDVAVDEVVELPGRR